MDQNTLATAVREETQQMISMMMLVIEGSSLRDVTSSPYGVQEAYQVYRDTNLVNTLIYSAERFEQLIRSGSKTIDALKMLRAEGVMNRYSQSIIKSGQEKH